MNFSLNSSIQLKATKAHRETEAPLPLTCGGEDSTIFISDDGEEEEAADDNDDDNDDFRMLSPQEVEQFSSRQSKNKQLPPGHSYRDHVTTKDALRVSREMTVERKDGGFFKIKRIIQNNTAGIILQGIPLQRHSDICPPSEGRSDYPLLRKVLNDVCMVLKCAPEENLDSVDQLCFEKMPLEDVVRKREILFTNRRPKDDEPHLHTQICRSLDKQRHKEHVRNHGTLHCRWVYVEEIDLVKGKTTGDHLLRRLTFGECTSGRRIPDVMLRQDYGKKNVTKSTNDRGSVERKRSAMQAAEVVDLSTDDDVFTTLAGSQHLRFSQPQYTFADICAGGGGVTCGADLAGLKPVLAVDNCEVATQTLKANFPGTRVVQIDIEEFALISRHRVDVVHISLPCQGLSFQNRGQNPVLDDMNNRLGTVLESLISNLRPRAITMEQTNGALTKHDGLWYRKYIQQLTELGYSVRWKVCNMGDTGHVQGRRRLMIQAACPGEKLSPWPPRTHGSELGLLPLTTVNDVLQSIPRNATLNDIPEAKRHQRLKPSTREIIDGDRPLKHLITTKGVTARHPEGYRLTMRQEASLQAFPHTYQFKGNSTEMRRMIGNAAPPSYMCLSFQAIIVTLRESDQEAKAWNDESIVVE